MSSNEKKLSGSSADDKFRKRSGTSVDSVYGHASTSPKATNFQIENPMMDELSVVHGPTVLPVSKEKRASLSASATSHVDVPKFLGKKKTSKTEEKEEKDGESDPRHQSYPAVTAETKARTQSEAVTRRETENNVYERYTQSDFTDLERAPTQDYDEVVQPLTVAPPATTHANAKLHRIFIHVRHFTKEYNKFPTTLQALIWFENGTCFGPVILGNHTRGEPLDIRLFKYHLVGEAHLDYPFASPVAFLQLRKRVGRVVTQLGLATDIFVQDAYIKSTAEHRPDDDILAYFRFTGFLVNRNNVLMPNLLTHDRRLKSSVVKQDSRNKNRFIQDKLLPELEWASVGASQQFLYKSRTVVDAIGTKTGYQFFVDTIFQRSQPLLFDIVYSLKLDIKRYEGSPGFCRLPPNDYTFSALKFTEFVGSRSEPIPYAHKVGARSKDPWRMSVIDFTPFLESDMSNTTPREITEVKWVLANYDKDEEFGRIYLESLFCNHIRVVRNTSGSFEEVLQNGDFSLPEPERARTCSGNRCFNFLHPNNAHVVRRDPEWVHDMIDELKLDASTMKLYFVDYSSLQGIPRNEDYGYFSPARCLFKFDTVTQRLVPLAIALYYPEQDRWKTHLPYQPSWAVAKLFCKCAGSQEHQIVSHALYTHLVVEPFAIALERQVPLDHMLYRLLKTHFRYTLDVNFKARTALLNAGGLFDQFVGTGGVHSGHIKYMVKMYNEWTFDKMCLPDELAQRGFEKDPDAEDCELPGYMYAKDGMVLWNALKKYIAQVIEVTYPTNEAYRKDDIARNFFMEVQTYGFPSAPSFYPTNKEELVHVLTGIIFTAAVQHAAVNFPQFAHYGFIANSPLILIKPAPEPGTPCRIFDYLPGPTEAVKAIMTVWGLSRFVTDDERFIYSTEKHFFNLSLFNDPVFRPICDELHATLARLENHILTRGPSKYGTNYQWLLPSMLPTSIAS